ncbi:MAG: TraB/GumN family protein [Deltaproteobacteria bacterium]|nr:TraB/GumN family protein [Deltaproteobacteria bacterium]
MRREATISKASGGGHAAPRSRVLPRPVSWRGCILRAAAVLLALAVASRVEAGEKHALWRIGSAVNSVYLVGSIHALPPGVYPLEEAFQRPFEESSALVLECDLAELAARPVQEALRQRTVLEGTGLSRRLAPGVRLRLEKVLREAGIDPSVVEHQKPWAVALFLGQLKIRRAGFWMEEGVDRHFFERAKKSGKAVVGLESPAAPLGIFDSLTEAEQESLLTEALNELASGEQDLKTIYDAWRSGDAGALASALQEPLAREPGLFRKLLTDRNEQWLPRIEGFLKETKTYFVVVGAAHLVGDHGLLEALRRKGYTVEQL